jgi:hypothetical protein
MKKFLPVISIIMLLFFMGSCISLTYSRPTIPPPNYKPHRTYIPAKPGLGYIWVSGHWGWNGHRYYWVNGRWIKNRRGKVYVQGRWIKNGPYYEWLHGYWKTVRIRKVHKVRIR